MTFQNRVSEAENDAWRESVRQKTAALYAKNPNCGLCRQKIEDIATAILWEPANLPAFLVCTRGECQLTALRTSVDRYLSKARKVS